MADEAIRNKWNQKYLQEGEGQWPAAEVLLENMHLLPIQGTALDLACGYGANAFILAGHGLQTLAWDISSVAINFIKENASNRNLDITAELVDLEVESMPSNKFDVIVIAHYLNRSLVPGIIKSLRQGALLFYQTFIDRKVNDAGPSRERFLLKPNELLHLFSSLQVIVYREEARVGDLKTGFRDKAMFIGRKND